MSNDSGVITENTRGGHAERIEDVFRGECAQRFPANALDHRRASR
jgi:hypothetical protein